METKFSRNRKRPGATDFRTLLLFCLCLCEVIRPTMSTVYTSTEPELVVFPDDVPANATEVILKGVQMEFIPIEYISHLTDVTKIDLSGNKLTNLENLTAIPSPAFRKLIISGNNFAPTLTAETFSGLSVTHITCQNCRMTSFPGDAFRNLNNTLTGLYLFNNPFAPISCGVDLYGFGKLTTLKLSKTSQTTFPDVSCLGETLVVLDLNGNPFTSIPEDVLAAMTKLRKLHLANNPLTHLPSFSLLGSTLTFLGLGGMHLPYLNRTSFLGMSMLKDLILLNDPAFPLTGIDQIDHLSSLKTLKLGSVINETIGTAFLQKFPLLRSFTIEGTIVCLQQPNTTDSLTVTFIDAQLLCDCCWSWMKDPDIDLAGLGITISGIVATDKPCSLGPDYLVNSQWGEITLHNLCPRSTSLASSAASTIKTSTDTNINWETTSTQPSSTHESTRTSITSATTSTSEFFTIISSTNPSIKHTTSTALVKRLFDDSFLQWGVWTAWTACTQTCGGGQRVRVVVCQQHANPIQSQCDRRISMGSRYVGYGVSHESCAQLPCPKGASWTPWTGWNTCSGSCGVSTRHRSRECFYGTSERGCGNSKKEFSLCVMEDCKSTSSAEVEESSNKRAMSPPELLESDRRTSAMALGSAYVLILLAILIAFVILDLPKIYSDLRGNRKKKRTKKKKSKK